MADGAKHVKTSGSRLRSLTLQQTRLISTPLTAFKRKVKCRVFPRTQEKIHLEYEASCPSNVWAGELLSSSDLPHLDIDKLAVCRIIWDLRWLSCSRQVVVMGSGCW